MRSVLLLAVLTLLVVGLVPAGQAVHAEAAPCTFVGAFADVRVRLGPERVGDCLENERHDGGGNAYQRTARGELIWLSSPGRAVFSDGERGIMPGVLSLDTLVPVAGKDAGGAPRPVANLRALDVLARSLLGVEHLTEGWQAYPLKLAGAQPSPDSDDCQVGVLGSMPPDAGITFTTFVHTRGRSLTQTVAVLERGAATSWFDALPEMMAACSIQTYVDPETKAEWRYTRGPSPQALTRFGDGVYAYRTLISRSAAENGEPEMAVVGHTVMVRRGDVVSTIDLFGPGPDAVSSRELAGLAARIDAQLRDVVGGAPTVVDDEGILDLDVDPAVLPSWRLLRSLRAGEDGRGGAEFAQIARDSGVRMRFSADVRAVAQHDPYLNEIRIHERYRGEHPTVIAATLAHELMHAQQALRGSSGPDDCIGSEVEAFRVEANVWSRIKHLYDRPLTGEARRLNRIVVLVRDEGDPGLARYVESIPGYRRSCGLPER